MPRKKVKGKKLAKKKPSEEVEEDLFSLMFPKEAAKLAEMSEDITQLQKQAGSLEERFRILTLRQATLPFCE